MPGTFPLLGSEGEIRHIPLPERGGGVHTCQWLWAARELVKNSESWPWEGWVGPWSEHCDEALKE